MQQMTPPPPPIEYSPAPPVSKPKGSPWITCAIGCAVVAGLIVVIGIAVFVWLLFPSKRTIELTRLAGPDTVAIVHLTDASDDEGVAAMLGMLQRMQQQMQLEALRQSGSDQGQKFAEWMLNLQHVNSINTSQIPEVIVVAEPGMEPEGNPGVGIGVGLNVLPKLITIPFRMIAKAASADGKEVAYREMKYADLEAEAKLMFAKGMFIFASETSVMHGIIDRFSKCDVELQ